jgi:AmmeMemoRadiSam system protein A
MAHHDALPLNDEQQRSLLQIARMALEARVRRTAAPVPEDVTSGLMRGAFVTILCRGELRGCLGRVAPGPLALTALIHHLAQEVADSDPRFDAVRPDELEQLLFEISVLTPEREVRTITEIEVGRHGLIVELGNRRGLLLPQVPVEQGWDRETFVAQTCRKAGLAIDAWQSGAQLFVFEAQVFGEL